MRRFTILLLLASTVIVSGYGSEPARGNWKQILADRLPVFGHRNWIVIADSAYPDQSSEGIETVVSGARQVEVLRYVMDVLKSAKHVRPNAFIDRELQALSESEVPGIEGYRIELKSLLDFGAVQTLPHEQIISKLAAASKTFRVLIIKTDMTLPYTSVFLQLDCAYWSAGEEAKFREALAKQKR